MKADHRTTFLTDRRPCTTLRGVPPGAEHETSIAPQMHVVLRGVFVPTMRLGRLRVGDVEIPFETVSDLPPRIYRPRINTAPLAEQLRATGVLKIAPLTIPAAMLVTVTLRNETASAVKPRASLILDGSCKMTIVLVEFP
jgi:hypothetical protein